MATNLANANAAKPIAAAATIAQMPANLLKSTIVPVVLEMMRLFPDGLVITSGIYALLTLSYPFAVFFGSMVEATVIFRFLRWVISYLDAARGKPTDDSVNEMYCRTGFSQPAAGYTGLSMFGYDSLPGSIPSAPIFMLTTAASYIFTTLNYQAKELQALGPAFSSRYYMSMILLSTLLFIFICFRAAFGCDSFGVLCLTLPMGLILGNLLVQQNTKLMGEQSINLLGIPLLRNRAANGQTLYVCAK
jgi:hypothetical protein